MQHADYTFIFVDGMQMYHSIASIGKRTLAPHFLSKLCTAVASFHHLQLIYDVQDGGGSIGLISTAPHKLTELKKIGVVIPTMV